MSRVLCPPCFMARFILSGDFLAPLGICGDTQASLMKGWGLLGDRTENPRGTKKIYIGAYEDQG